jgi:hypothetical protein
VTETNRATSEVKLKTLKKKLSSLLFTGYAPLLADLKARVRTAEVQAALSVNRELILLYWHMGREILQCRLETILHKLV